MIIKNALLKDGVCDILIEDGIIKGLGKFDGDDVVDAKGKRVIAGPIDTHIHGYGGLDTSDSRLNEMSKFLADKGTTSWVPTAMTLSHEHYLEITSNDLKTEGAEVLGFHLEGPYLSKAKKGAQNENYIVNPDIEKFKQYKNVLKVTVAPEVEGAIDFIKQAGCHVSIGHTSCDKETALKAIDAGADCLTHTFNAMPPLHHREPGPIGAAIDRNIYVEVIGDGMHVNKSIVLMLYRTFGSDRVIIISDTVRPAGMPDGKYDSGGLEIFLKDGIITLGDGVIAGGSNSLLKNIKTVYEMGIDFYEAVKMATETPAKYLGVNKGVIAEGYDADLVIIDDEFEPEHVIIGGKLYK